MHITQRELNFVRSLKKHIVDALAPTVPVFFERKNEVPVDPITDKKLNMWVVFELSVERKGGTLAKQIIEADLFVRKDTENEGMIGLTDAVVEAFTSADGDAVSIPYYDITTWDEVGGIVTIVGQASEIYPAKDRTSVRSLPIKCYWGSV